MKKIIQISSVPYGENDTAYNRAYLFALCDDGSVWKLESETTPDWMKLPDIPQDATSSVPKEYSQELGQASPFINRHMESPVCAGCGQNLQLGLHNTNCHNI